MTATTVKSENITNIEADPQVVLNNKSDRLRVHIDKTAVLTTSTDEVGDKVLIGLIPSNAIILDIEILNDDMDTHDTPTLAVDWGLYYSGRGGNQVLDGRVAGDAVDADCFASADTSLQGANVTYKSIRFEEDDIVNVTKEAWEVGGLTTDPGGLLYVGAAVTTVAATGVASADLVVKITYIV